MKIYHEHAYSTDYTMFYQCRAIRGDGFYFMVQITKTSAGGTLNDRAYVSRMDLDGMYAIEVLLDLPSSELRVYGETMVFTTSRDKSAPWKKVARGDALGLLKRASQSVPLTTSPNSGAQAMNVFRFKKTGREDVG